MRRIARPLFTIPAAVSLLLCAVTVALWVRSFDVADQLMFRGTGSSRWIASDRGTVLLFHRPRIPDEDTRRWMLAQAPPGQFQLLLVRSPAELRSLQFRGIGLYQIMVSVHGIWTHPRRMVTVILISHWVLCLLSAVLPVWWLIAYQRTRARARRGNCPTCGYDLRATPDRCPECGAANPRAV